VIIILVVWVLILIIITTTKINKNSGWSRTIFKLIVARLGRVPPFHSLDKWGLDQNGAGPEPWEIAGVNDAWMNVL